MKSLPLESETDAPPAATIPLRDRIAGIFSEKLHIEVASAETDLMQTGLLDSLALVELLFHLEQELGIKISLETIELENFRSIARIAAFIAAHDGASRNGFNGPA
ncbi:MAG TPA: acyl carrier protein [Verrucomicrobiae bacterium]|jgi:acyl carrier protein|nr:acyl carrier protein [Verrucomicrobiae bacterium]